MATSEDKRHDPEQKAGDITRPMPAAPKQAKPKVAAKDVPTASDLIAPAGNVDLDGLDPETLVNVAKNYVGAIYENLERNFDLAIKRLAAPPPPPDRSAALRVLEFFTDAIVGSLVGRVGDAVLDALKARAVSEPARNIVKDHLGSIKGLAGKLPGALSSAGASGHRGIKPDEPDVVANPAALSLLDEFGERAKTKLNGRKANAATQLEIAAKRVHRSHPSEVAMLVEALQQYAGTTTLGAWLQQEVAMSWLNFCSAISVGERAPGETAMPDANKIGGSVSTDWRRERSGFVEIEVDFPEHVRGLAGVTIGKVGVTTESPGAVAILKTMMDGNSGMSLHKLPMYRRLWLGRNKTDRSPDLVITPDHRLEVNTNSSLLAAVGSGSFGEYDVLHSEGRREGAEQAQLLEKAESGPTHEAPTGEGRLSPLLGRQSLTPGEAKRLGNLAMRSIHRASEAQQGARIMMGLLSGITTAEITE